MARRGGTEDDRRARGDETRRALIDAGRRLFVDKGFFNTSIGHLVEASGVGTRGAFYHHFADKAELFNAVFEEVEHDLTTRAIATPPRGADPWEQLTRGLHEFVEAALEPEVQRVMLIDGPVVLGWEKQRRIQRGDSIAMIEEVIGEAIAAGVIDDQPVAELAQILVASAEEAALMVAHSDAPATTRKTAAAVLDRILASFATHDPNAR
ncbi:TetR/AcrR family transcriptional regulator [Mycolicibacterium sp. 3033]|nr:TetR/AcrR family transcriptional regulator [Mycolicibacterium aurantiacum]